MTVSQETCLKHACTAIKCDLLKNAFIYDIVSAQEALKARRFHMIQLRVVKP